MPGRTIPIYRETIPTSSRSEMIDVTDRVRRAAAAALVTDGYAIVYVPHTTACVAKLRLDAKCQSAKGFTALAGGSRLPERAKNARGEHEEGPLGPWSVAARSGKDHWRESSDD